MAGASRGLLQGLFQAWQDKHCSDVTIVGRDGVEVRAHRIVLATTSPMLAQAFHLDVLTHSHEDSYILCPDLSSHDLLALLAPMYQGGAHPVVQDDAMTALGIEPSGSQVATEPLSLTPEDRHSLTMADPITSPEPEREEVASPWLKSRYRFTGSTALCRICEKEYQYRGSKSDGILIRHSKRQHPEVDEESEERQGECNDRLYRPDREREEDRHGSSVEAVAGKPETNSESDFVRHYFDIHGTKASCKHCSSRPISIASGSKALRHHIANKHPHLLSDTGAVQYLVLSDQLIQCQTCGQELEVLAADRDQVLQNHQKECLSASQPVGKENESDPSRILLSSYFSPHAPSEQSLTCSACLKEFETTDNIYQKLERHLCCAHTDLYDEYVRKRDKLTSIENQAVAQIFDKVSGFFRVKSDSNLVQACQECDQAIKLKSSDDIRSLVIHIKRRHQDLLTEWLAESTSSLAELDKALSHRKRQIRKRPTANDDPLNRTCQHCSKVFSRTINLQLHVAAVHSGNRPFKCDTCDATFTRKETYMRHGHVNNRPFLCSVCGNTFARRHIRDIHERAHFGDKRYGCAFCNKRFVTNQKKTNHERTHTGEKPFGCDICGKRFAQKHQLTTHSRVHTGERPFKCENCHRMFRHLTTRARHNCVGFLENAQEFVLRGNKSSEGIQTIEIFPGDGVNESDQVIVRTDALESM